MTDLIAWLENSLLGNYMLDSIWAYPVVLSAHAVGMSIVVGTVVIMDLRLIGFASEARLDSFKSMFALTWFGVALNFLSGVALLVSDPAHFFYHPVFWIKMGLMFSGVISVYFLWRQINLEGNNMQGIFGASSRVKLLAGLSLIVWLSVIVAGRLIAYIEIA
jgi:hypothetical protein